MQIGTKRAGAVLVVEPTAKCLDAQVAIDFKEQKDGFISGGNHHIDINLSDVDFIPLVVEAIYIREGEKSHTHNERECSTWESQPSNLRKTLSPGRLQVV